MSKSKQFFQYDSPNGKLWGFRKEYKQRQLRKKGFSTKSDAELKLREEMNDVDALERGEIRCKPTTAQEALNIYRRKLEVRSKDKGYQYGHNLRSNCKIVQEFVDRFGPNRLVREVTQTELREFYQVLCFRISKNSAGAHMGRVQGMLKAAQESKPDLVNWLRPKLSVRRKPENERRAVEPEEYQKLVDILLNPPPAPSRRAERNALWRDAGDVVQLLRLTGGRLNEVLRIKINQFLWDKEKVLLFASKTENERYVPLSKGVARIVHARLREGLSDDEFLFPRARVSTFDNAIARACRKAASLAKLRYGQKNGFTCHSFRHTFITHLLIQTKDIPGTMELSGHKTVESFSGYLHLLDTGYTNAAEILDQVDGFLTGLERSERQEREERTGDEAANPLTLKQVAVSSAS
jgi:integrase